MSRHRFVPTACALPTKNRAIAVRLAILLTAVFLSGGKTAFAINNGQNDDGNLYPNVGTILIDRGPDAIPQACTGTLIADRAFLTAAHCNASIDGGIANGTITMDDVHVSFDPNDPLNPATWLDVDSTSIHPDYRGIPAFHDVGILFLKEDAVGIVPAELAPIGYLDELSDDGTLSKKNRAEFTVVGYGAVRSFPEREFSDPGGIRRRFATGEFQNLEPNFLHLNQVQSPGRDNGGTCFGDSGGPGFWTDGNGQQILTSVTSWGDFECVATDKRQRIDIESVRAYIDAQLATAAPSGSVVAIPEPAGLTLGLVAVSLLAGGSRRRPLPFNPTELTDFASIPQTPRAVGRSTIGGNMQLNTHLGLPAEVDSSVEVARRGPLSRDARRRLVGRFSHALYRWYLSRSQETRNWNPDRSFNWCRLRQDHDERLMSVVEGFYAVEQYAPDYTAELTRLARRGYGHSQFQIRWGAEEEKHADLWRNVLLFGRARTPDQLEQYTDDLRANAWVAPFDNPLEMLFYTVFQERATQLIYLKTGELARGAGSNEAIDPVLAGAVSAIAFDEAAHYDFFLAMARVHLYYFPEEALDALVKVLRNFVMPAARIVPNYDAFTRVLYEARLFSPGIYGREVAKPALAALGIESVRAVEQGLVQTKATPSLNGTIRPAPYAGCNFAVLESAVRGLFDRVGRYESQIGLNHIQQTVFATAED